MTALLLLTLMPLKAGTEPTPMALSETKAAESAEANALIARLGEIKAMDRSNLTSSEKRQLRKEVRATKKRLNEVGGGVYLSIGAIIIIILLLVLIL